MPTFTSFGTANPLTMKKWSMDSFVYGMQNMFFAKYGMMTVDVPGGKLYEQVGPPEGIIHVNTDLGKQKGDVVYFRLVRPLVGDGQGDDGQVLGNGEKLVVNNMSISLHELAHSAQPFGKLSGQRTVTEYRRTSQQELGKWFANKYETAIYNAAAGLYNWSSGVSIINELAPSTNRILYCGQSAAGTYATYDTDALLSAATEANTLFGPQCIEHAEDIAKLADPKIMPVQIEGEECYVMLIHPWQRRALMATTAWADIQKYANLRGKTNPFFSGTLGKWGKVWLFEYERCAYRTGANGTTPAEGFTLNGGKTATTDAVANGRTVCRAVLMGRDAVGVLIGQEFKLYETTIERDIGETECDCMLGVKKCRFNDYNDSTGAKTAYDDYATVVVDTGAIPR